MNARELLASVTGYCDACGAGPGVVCDPFCLGVAAEQDEQPCEVCESRVCVVCARPGCVGRITDEGDLCPYFRSPRLRTYGSAR